MPADPSGVDDEAFWLRHLRLGIVLFALGTAIALTYVFAGDPAHPSALLGMGVIALVSCCGVAFLPHDRIVRSPRRHVFFYAWSGFSVAFVLATAAVDDGAGSPMSVLLALPVVYSGLAYPPPVVVAVALAAGFGYLGLALVGPDAPAGMVIVLPGAIVCLGISSAAVAGSRQRSLDDLLALHNRLEIAARTDGLTGCLTRGAFHDALAGALARRARHGRPLAVLVVDLDDFKAVNDAGGHLLGDQRLEALGRVLRSSLRAGDEAGRLGGDEFAVLLPDADRSDAALAARRLLASMTEVEITASVGVAAAQDGDHVDSILARADEAMYAAKRAGKARVEIAV